MRTNRSALLFSPRFSRWGSVLTEVFLAPVAQPDAENLGDLFFLGFGKAVVELKGPLAFEAGDTVAVGVPVGPREANTTRCFFDQGRPGQVVVIDLTLFCHFSSVYYANCHP